MTEPLAPRITKSTAVAAIKARFSSEAELLKRFEVAKSQANLWDGERDGLREVVKTLPSGQYDNVILSKSESAPVLYPNSSGKHQLENCIQCTISSHEPDMPIVVLQGTPDTPEEFLDQILSLMSKGKDHALEYLKISWVGHGETVDNYGLFEKKGSEIARITIL